MPKTWKSIGDALTQTPRENKQVILTPPHIGNYLGFVVMFQGLHPWRFVYLEGGPAVISRIFGAQALGSMVEGLGSLFRMWV